MSYPADSEFVFELLTCRWAERAWPPESDRESALVVARQLGTKRRRWDTVVVEADPEALAARAAFGDDELDSNLLHVARHAPAEWTWYRDALPHPGYPWRYVLAAIHRAAARGVVEKRRKGRRIEIRRIAPYPDWIRRIVAIENKPDLDASAARALSGQLEHDVETALADEVWLATAATDAAVEPALLESIPVDVGILALDFSAGVRADAGEVAWYPSSLSPRADGDGVDSGDCGDRAETRLRLAERAYGRGWRSYHSTMRQDCRHFELRRAGDALLPWCAAKGRHQTAAECAGSCGSFQPEPPQWRTRGWPIEGGPGKGIERLLERRRARVRERSAPDSR
ncbi:DUF5787 family protein [Haloprofundus sp. MHR1]|uniref:DUF5787 family protein n=1 Tax=Haloprofundus sp. MHR1 TaxID=2572921 RepID=UPI0010BF2B65|nr:DUF5787 family protein [Haloprofundus sp. MHR1]QCJ48049.1 hypothetical protein FCF25_13370 [Haloprofundus sp. MHR1]